MKTTKAKHYEGFTAEGFHFQLVAFYRDNAEQPFKIMGSYGSDDGGGRFDVEDESDLPWVVGEGEWCRVM